MKQHTVQIGTIENKSRPKANNTQARDATKNTSSEIASKTKDTKSLEGGVENRLWDGHPKRPNTLHVGQVQASANKEVKVGSSKFPPEKSAKSPSKTPTNKPPVRTQQDQTKKPPVDVKNGSSPQAKGEPDRQRVAAMKPQEGKTFKRGMKQNDYDKDNLKEDTNTVATKTHSAYKRTRTGSRKKDTSESIERDGDSDDGLDQ